MQSGYTINKRFERISTFHNVGQRTLYFVSIMFRNVQQATLYDDTTTFRNVGQRTLQALYVCIGLLLYSEGRMEEHGMYQIILDNILRVLRIIWSRS